MKGGGRRFASLPVGAFVFFDVSTFRAISVCKPALLVPCGSKKCDACLSSSKMGGGELGVRRLRQGERGLRDQG